MHPALAAKRPALPFTDAADYLNKAGLTGGARVQAGELLDWAIRENCVSVFLPLRVRARQKDAPAGRVEQIDGVLALVLDDVGRLEAHRLYLELAYLDGWTVHVTGRDGATVTRDGVVYELLDPQRETNSETNAQAGSALPTHAHLVVSRDALARFLATLSPVAAPTASVNDAEKATDPKDPKPFRVEDYDLGKLAKDWARYAQRREAMDHFSAECARISDRLNVPRTEIAKLLETHERTLRNWINGVQISQDLHTKVLKLFERGPQKIAKTDAD